MAWELLLFGPILIVTVLVHEMGHCLATRAVGGHVDHILLWPLGGLAFVGHGGGPKQDILVAVAGPLTHVPLAATCLAVMAGINGGRLDWHLYSPNEDYFWENLVAATLIMQVALFCFNLLVPAYPLDGGRVLVDALFLCGVTERVAAIVCVGISIPIALGLVAWGILSGQLTTMLVAAWIIAQGLQIVSMLRKGLIAHHPMFHLEPAAGGRNEAYAAEVPSSQYNNNTTTNNSSGVGSVNSNGNGRGVGGSGNIALPTFSNSSGVPPIGRGKPLSHQENMVYDNSV